MQLFFFVAFFFFAACATDALDHALDISCPKTMDIGGFVECIVHAPARLFMGINSVKIVEGSIEGKIYKWAKQGERVGIVTVFDRWDQNKNLPTGMYKLRVELDPTTKNPPYKFWGTVRVTAIDSTHKEASFDIAVGDTCTERVCYSSNEGRGAAVWKVLKTPPALTCGKECNRYQCCFQSDEKEPVEVTYTHWKTCGTRGPNNIWLFPDQLKKLEAANLDKYDGPVQTRSVNHCWEINPAGEITKDAKKGACAHKSKGNLARKCLDMPILKTSGSCDVTKMIDGNYVKVTGSCLPKLQCEHAGRMPRVGFCPYDTHGNNLCCINPLQGF